MRIILASAEAAGVIQSEIDRQCLDGELKVRRERFIAPDLIALTADDGTLLCHQPLAAVLALRGGLRALLRVFDGI